MNQQKKRENERKLHMQAWVQMQNTVRRAAERAAAEWQEKADEARRMAKSSG